MHSKEESGKISITRIVIKNLFNQYNYYIPHTELQTDYSRILILYGDNGSGKTTILKLIYNTLNIHLSKIHAEYLFNIPFSLFELTLSNNIIIKVFRDGESHIGPFTIEISEESKTPINAKMTAEYDSEENIFKFRSRQSYSKKISLFMERLLNINLTIYFLSDDRRFESSIESEREKERELYRRRKTIYIQRSRDLEPINLTYVENAFERAQNWFNKQIAYAIKEGDIDVNDIYLEMIKNITHPTSELDYKPIQKSELIQDLKKISNKIDLYSKYNLTSFPRINEIIDLIQDITLDYFKPISNAIGPYVNGLNAKLKALEEVYDKIHIFISLLKGFMSNKKVEYKYNEGGLIIKSGDQEIPLKLLSSGERQLIMLFCNTFQSKKETSIFIIDEPEISLNIKWQRKLIKALLNLTEDSPIQYIFATHSIELLSQFKTFRVKLENKSS